jgi:glutamyl-tRNA reductase
MAELTVEAFRRRGACKVVVVNRTLERARLLANRLDGVAETFENLPQVIERSDVLITSTSAPHTLVDFALVSLAMEKRSQRPLVIIDIAVPRDVEANVGEVPNVLLYELDALQENLDHCVEQRRMEAQKVETILAEELDAYTEYMNSLDLLPLIASLRQKAEIIRQTELNKTLRRFPDLSEAERTHLEAMTLAMVKKILHEPTTRLREEAGGPRVTEYATLVRALFGLGESANFTGPTGQ